MDQCWPLIVVLLLLVFYDASCSSDGKLYNYIFDDLRPPAIDDQLQQAVGAATTEERYFTQHLDHFNVADTRTFQQRYFVNNNFYTAGSPVILFIEGQSVDVGGYFSYIETIPVVSWAKQLNATVIELEHRFYGKSRPFELQTTDNLRFLSSRQAVEDTAEFIKTSLETYPNSPWILYGGSYAAALAIWFQAKHPDLAIGIVASSAPVPGLLDNHGFGEAVDDVLDSNLFPSCKAALVDGFSTINNLIWTAEGRQQLSATFRTNVNFENTTLRDKEFQLFFNGILIQIFKAVQYNGVNVNNNPGISTFCGIMTNQTSTLTNVERIAQVTFTLLGAQVVNLNYDLLVQALSNESYDETGSVAARRSWMWQTCSELGYFQTTDYGRSMFGSTLPLNFYMNLCKDVFGPQLTIENIQNNIHDTNEYYGGQNLKVTNAVVLYGTKDPWTRLHNFLYDDSTVVMKIIDGTSHCADMYPAGPNDPPELTAARNLTFETIKKWINGQRNVHHSEKSINTPDAQTPKLKPFVSTVVETPLSSAENKKSDQRAKQRQLRTDMPLVLLGRPFHSLVPDPSDDQVGSAAESDQIWSGTIIQRIDHYNSSNNGTFEQRYWKSMKYYRKDGPQFLFLEGESPARTKWLTTNVTFLRAVQEHGAVAYVLEHRFYGDSRPYGNMASSSLKYLTTKQALADVAQFIKTMNKLEPTMSRKWITFGGSYPGQLSAWFRQEYPELTVGAVASSAGTEIKADFFEYLMVTEQSLRHYSPECGDNVKQAFLEMQRMSLTPAGRVELSNTFKLNPPWKLDTNVTTRDIQFFFQNVYGLYQTAVQYNNDNTGTYMYGGGIKETCQIMNDASLGVVQRVAKAYEYIINFHDGNFTQLDNSYDAFVKLLRTEDYSDEGASSARGWMYSCCTEIGYLQSTDIGDNAFASTTPIDYWLNFCEDVFGKDYVPARNVYSLVSAGQQQRHGRDHYLATNVVFVSGKIDPWHAMAISKQRETDTMKIFLLNETAHCADMYPPLAQDPAELVSVRESIFANIRQWLIESPPSTTGVPPSDSTRPPADSTVTTMESTRAASSLSLTFIFIFLSKLLSNGS